MRIQGGELKGRTIEAPKGLATRPTAARVREALFSALLGRLEEARVLDLFCGSGILGFEAVSRGAKSVVSVERHRPTAMGVVKNAKSLGIGDRVQVWVEDVLKIQHRLEREVGEQGGFDLVFMDPPYKEDYEKRLLQGIEWERVVAPSGRIVLESSSRLMDRIPEAFGGFVQIGQKKYGETVVTSYEAR